MDTYTQLYDTEEANDHFFGDKIAALAKLLNAYADEIRCDGASGNNFIVDGSEYIVLTEEEADAMVKERIMEDLWAFNAWFILEHVDNDRVTEHQIAIMQEKLGEEANPIIESLIGDNMDSFIEDAIVADGRGHFLNNYDGTEEEINGFLIYRWN